MDVNVDFDVQLEKLGKIPRAARLGGVVGILVAISAGYFFLLYQDAHNTLVQYRNTEQEIQRRLTNIRAVANNVGKFEQEVAALERELEGALKQLPNGKRFEDLLQDITTAGKKVGVAIKSVQREPEVEHDFYAEVPFRIEIEGNYHNIAMFFERVAKLARIVNIGAMNVEVVGDRGGEKQLRVKGSATTFRFLSPEEQV